MQHSADIEWKVSFLMLFFLIAVPIFILVAVVVIRTLMKGNWIPALFFGLATGFALFIGALFFTLKGPNASVHQEARREMLSTTRKPILAQPKLADVMASAASKPVAELPLVARKPNNSATDSIDSLVQSKVFPPEPLPDWVVSGLEKTKQNQSNLLESSRLVFQSGLFATREEAMQSVLAEAMQQLQANLLMRYPQYKSSLWKLNPDLIRQLAYRKVHYQVVEHDFGNVLKSGKPFKQDMFRAYLEVEDSPVVRQALLTKWKRNIGNERTVWLGGGFGLVTLLCAAVAVYLRATHDPATIKQS